MKNAFVRIRTEEPNYAGLPDANYDWELSVYKNVTEEMPIGAPKGLWKCVITASFKDTNLYHDLATGHTVTSVLHFLNQTPIDWYTRRMNVQNRK